MCAAFVAAGCPFVINVSQNILHADTILLYILWFFARKMGYFSVWRGAEGGMASRMRLTFRTTIHITFNISFAGILKSWPIWGGECRRRRRHCRHSNIASTSNYMRTLRSINKYLCVFIDVCVCLCVLMLAILISFAWPNLFDIFPVEMKDTAQNVADNIPYIFFSGPVWLVIIW